MLISGEICEIQTNSESFARNSGDRRQSTLKDRARVFGPCVLAMELPERRIKNLSRQTRTVLFCRICLSSRWLSFLLDTCRAEPLIARKQLNAFHVCIPSWRGRHGTLDCERGKEGRFWCSGDQDIRLGLTFAKILNAVVRWCRDEYHEIRQYTRMQHE